MPVRVDRVGHASQLCARLSALLASSSLIDLEISCEQRIVAAHKLVMAAASKFFAERLCRTDLNVAVAVHLEDFGVHISHCALAFVVQFVYQGSIVIPDDMVEAVGKAAEALGVDGLDHLLQQEQLLGRGESRSKRGPTPEQMQQLRPEEEHGDKGEEASLLCIEIDGDLNVVRGNKRKTHRSSEQSGTNIKEPRRRRSEERRVQHQKRLGQGQELPEQPPPFTQDEAIQQPREAHRPLLYVQQQEETHLPAESYVNQVGQEPQNDGHQQQEMQHQFCEQRNNKATEELGMQERLSQEEPLGSNNSGQQLEALQHQSEPLVSEEHRDQLPQVREEQQMAAYELQYLQNQQLEQQDCTSLEQECRSKEQEWQRQPVLVPMTGTSANTSTHEGLSLQMLQELREQLVNDWANHSEAINNLNTSKQGPSVEDSSVDAVTEMNRRAGTPVQVMALGRPIAMDATDSAPMPRDESIVVQEGTKETTRESTIATVPDSSSSYIDLSLNTNSSTLFPCPAPPDAFNTTQLTPRVEDDRMLAIRSGVPIALQSRRRRRKDNNETAANKKRSIEDCDRRGDLGIRKDLTLPTAPNGEDNVFQPENVMIDELSQFPVIHIDDNDSELENAADDMGLVEDNDDNNESALNFSAVDEIINDNDNEESTPIDIGTGNAGFTCLECTMTFAKPDQLRMHVRHAHQKEETVFCPVCKQGGIKGKQNLKLHLYYAHAIGEIFRCEECGFETANKSAFNRHKQKHGSSLASTRANFRCEQCDKEFTTKRRYDNHCRTHAQPSVFKCQYCEFSSSQRRSLVTHLVVKHHKDVEGNVIEASVTCAICNYKCFTANQLRVHHRRKHTSWESMRYKCDLCDYATVEKGALVKHIRFKHTKEKPFKCSQCDYSACTQSSLLRHQRSHQRLKPYECSSCGQKFADKKRRDEHERSHETNGAGKKFVQCPVCPFTTARKDNLTSHMRRKHLSVFESNSTAGSNDAASNMDDNIHQSTTSHDGTDRSHIVGLVKSDGSIRPVARTTLTTPTRESSLEADEEDNGRVRVEFIEPSLSGPVTSTTTSTLLPSSMSFSSSLSQLSVSTATVLNPDDPEANAEEIIVFQSNSDAIATNLTFTN